jgi:hypothetical protein
MTRDVTALEHWRIDLQIMLDHLVERLRGSGPNVLSHPTDCCLDKAAGALELALQDIDRDLARANATAS